MISKLCGMKVSAIASAVSTRWESLRECSNENEYVLKKFTKTTGVEERWISEPKQTTADLCCAAAEKILCGGGY